MRPGPKAHSEEPRARPWRLGCAWSRGPLGGVTGKPEAGGSEEGGCSAPGGRRAGPQAFSLPQTSVRVPSPRWVHGAARTSRPDHSGPGTPSCPEACAAGALAWAGVGVVPQNGGGSAGEGQPPRGRAQGGQEGMPGCRPPPQALSSLQRGIRPGVPALLKEHRLSHPRPQHNKQALTASAVCSFWWQQRNQVALAGGPPEPWDLPGERQRGGVPGLGGAGARPHGAEAWLCQGPSRGLPWAPMPWPRPARCPTLRATTCAPGSHRRLTAGPRGPSQTAAQSPGAPFSPELTRKAELCPAAVSEAISLSCNERS